ncbi:MAG: hypothetical protein ACRDLN_07545 [Solirubrobacteraceae bacterium]
MTPSNTSRGGSVDLPTLAITAVASAAAAYACSKIWAPGTLASAAFTPVLVALIKEALARPAYAVTRAVPVRGVVRSSTPGDAPGEPAQRQPADDRVARHSEISGGSFGRRAWKTAIVTGLLGFLIAAVIITIPEVVAGKSASGGGRQTTLFGGDERRADREPSETTTTTVPTVTAPPAETVTVPPAETTTVAPETTTVPPDDETLTVPPDEETTTVPPEESATPEVPPPPP